MKTILIVDDNKFLRDALVLTIKNLSGIKFSVVHAANGRDAVDILTSTDVDLIVTDIQMPVMDGFKLLEYRNLHHPAIGAIVMTADASPDVMEKLLTFGITECLEKPFNHDSIVRMIGTKLQTAHRLSARTDTTAAPVYQLTSPGPGTA